MQPVAMIVHSVCHAVNAAGGANGKACKVTRCTGRSGVFCRRPPFPAVTKQLHKHAAPPTPCAHSGKLFELTCFI